ncbi:MAG TPA: hypothetical protein DIS90_04735 [Cytophagales bacterium]|nr:hypothetical protein [Cytophagales bacterium]HCR54302.1 hypothetical protein [Cytophagales bacterium]
MKNKKNIIKVLTVFVALLVIFSGIMKLVGDEEVVQVMANVGVDQYVPYLGLMEITFGVLFLFPKTFKLGFILLSCYFAGAIATELSHQGSIYNPLFLLVLIWIATYLNNPAVFLTITDLNKQEA